MYSVYTVYTEPVEVNGVKVNKVEPIYAVYTEPVEVSKVEVRRYLSR